MDVASLVNSFATGTYTVTRRAAATFTAGRQVAGATSTFTISASVQPASGRDLLRLPEGRRSLETRTLYTTTQLFAGAQGAANEADLVALDGGTWEVEHVESWRPPVPGDLTYFRCMVQSKEGV